MDSLILAFYPLVFWGAETGFKSKGGIQIA